MKKALLGSTALAGALFVAGAPAPAKALDVILGGFVGFEAIGAGQDRLDGSFDDEGDSSDRGYQFATDTELLVRAEGVTDGGVIYGAKVEVEADQSSDFVADEVQLFFSGGFGRFEFGAEDGAEDQMQLTAATIAAGTGGIDGTLDVALGTKFFVTDSGDAVKATYYTPRVAGFQAGVSFTPDTGDEGDNEDLTGDESGDFENHVGAGLNYLGEFGAVELGLSAVISAADAEEDFTTGTTGDDLFSYAFGGTLGFGGLSFGGSIDFEEDINEGTFVSAGVGYDFGPIGTSFNYNYADFDDDDTADTADRNIFVVSADTGLMPGVTLGGDVAYADYDDPGDGFWAGVAKLNLAF